MKEDSKKTLERMKENYSDVKKSLEALGKEIENLEPPQIEKGTKVYCWDGDTRPEFPWMGYYVNKGLLKYAVNIGGLDEDEEYFEHCEPIETKPLTDYSLWIARDFDGECYYYTEKPVWCEDDGTWSGNDDFFKILEKTFPDLKHTDEPIRIKI